MSCLFYCVCRHPGPELSGSLLGVGGRPVYQVAHRGLSVALSQIGLADLDPDIPRVRAYERVVLSYHRQGRRGPHALRLRGGAGIPGYPTPGGTRPPL